VRDGLLLLAALVAAFIGFAWLALAMETHWRQAVKRGSLDRRRTRMLRIAGALALALSLGLCMQVDHASMASLVWVMGLAAAALAVTFVLTWKAHWLALLVGRSGR
jgi:hypothetical protein